MILNDTEFDFYFIRHGESESNVTPGVAAGANFDAPMTERGHKQAEAVGRRLAKEGVAFDRIYSSSMVRAVQTTQGMLRGMGQPDREFDRVGRHHGTAGSLLAGTSDIRGMDPRSNAVGSR